MPLVWKLKTLQNITTHNAGAVNALSTTDCRSKYMCNISKKLLLFIKLDNVEYTKFQSNCLNAIVSTSILVMIGTCNVKTTLITD